MFLFVSQVRQHSVHFCFTHVKCQIIHTAPFKKLRRCLLLKKEKKRREGSRIHLSDKWCMLYTSVLVCDSEHGRRCLSGKILLSFRTCLWAPYRAPIGPQTTLGSTDLNLSPRDACGSGWCAVYHTAEKISFGYF